ncbi:MAG: ABC transporter permease [Bacteroidetes bacterium]|nr:ABC transporter permease [Bacteroidota bacterium]
MRNSWLVAKRELKERISNSAFLWMLFIGPIVSLFLIYLLFKAGDEGKSTLRILIVDPINLMDTKIVAQEGKTIDYYFTDKYIEVEEFRDSKKYKDFDALMEVNEKILMNKKAFIFYRESPSPDLKMQLKFQLERRVEEVMIEEFTRLSVDEFRQIKQPLNVDFRNVYDPKNEASDMEGWVGFVFGAIIVLFVLLFGMTILRSTTREKSNRIVEVLLASVKPSRLMLGKITGIGISALIQIIGWIILISLGLFVFRQTIFPDLFDLSSWEGIQVTSDVQQQIIDSTPVGRYNQFIELIYERINFGYMLIHFMLLFVLAYFFYGSFFSAIGATAGTESDGQQFLFPILFILGFSLYAGYYAIILPDSQFTQWMQFIPFTSPVVVMVKIAQGYPDGTYYFAIFSILILIVSTYVFLSIAGRLYKNGILQFGHQVRIRNLISWLKKS